MALTTGSATWDLILQVAIALALLVSLALTARNYLSREDRDRR